MSNDPQNPSSLDLNVMADDQLKELVKDPNAALLPVKDEFYKPTVISSATRDRMKNLLSDGQLDDQQIKNRIDKVAAIKIKNIIIDF